MTRGASRSIAQNAPENAVNDTAPVGPASCYPFCIMKVSALVERIRGEFREMPGLQLTPDQAQRLFGLDPAACRHVVDTLVEASFLRWTASGTIVQA